MEEEKIQPELADIIEMIHRYCASHKNEVCFIANFIAFKEVPAGTKCPECGDECNHEVSDEGSRVLAYGDLDTLRELINEMRDLVEDECDKRGFVNI